jgi:GTP-binding protein HflX
MNRGLSPALTGAGSTAWSEAWQTVARRWGITSQVHGAVGGLKAVQREALERLYRRSVAPGEVVSRELAQQLAVVAGDLHRQVGVLLDRRGRVAHVMVGDAERLLLPDLGRQRAGRGRLRGLRLVHVHVGGEGLSRDDLTDLAKLGLDLVAVVGLGVQGEAATIEVAHLDPEEGQRVLPVVRLGALSLDVEALVAGLEARFAASGRLVTSEEGLVRAVAVHVTPHPPGSETVIRALAELEELGRSAGVTFVETLVQRRAEPDPRTVVGEGKLVEVGLAALQHDAELVVFDAALSPSQARAIAVALESKVIDRTQLILDIFAQRARTNEGKLQVELAQLRYTLPRLAGKNPAMSRLMGGIGGRGPGESRLELDRRRAKERIGALEGRIAELARQRAVRRARRVASEVPQAVIVGYTNAGKSTLLNALTGSNVVSEDKLFATLDPTTRRLAFAEGLALVVTDTVGFIRDLPPALVPAFKATLEEVAEAAVRIHVVDVSQAGWEARIAAVERVLSEVAEAALSGGPARPGGVTPEGGRPDGGVGVGTPVSLMVFNKADLVDDAEQLRWQARRWDAVVVSAADPRSLGPLRERLKAVAAGSRPPQGAAAGAPPSF